WRDCAGEAGCLDDEAFVRAFRAAAIISAAPFGAAGADGAADAGATAAGDVSGADMAALAAAHALARRILDGTLHRAAKEAGAVEEAAFVAEMLSPAAVATLAEREIATRAIFCLLEAKGRRRRPPWYSTDDAAATATKMMAAAPATSLAATVLGAVE
ncbi:unnamed protein product, partial [Phaeothamnion confervicola]